MHNIQQTNSITATLIPNTKFAINANGTIAVKKIDRFFKIIEHISIIRSTIKAATPASIPFKIAVIYALETNTL